MHEDADLEMAPRIVVNAKTQRPGVCNAMETLLVNRERRQAALERAYAALKPARQWFACPETLAILKGKAHVHAARRRRASTPNTSISR